MLRHRGWRLTRRFLLLVYTMNMLMNVQSKGVMVNSELLARTDIYVAGDTAR